jgi:glycosyltransferase involved in cell wall biosynthesis
MFAAGAEGVCCLSISYVKRKVNLRTGSMRVGILVDYVPQYREAFYSRLIQRLGEDGIECVVIAGRPTGSLELLADTVELKPWMRLAKPRSLKIGAGGPRFTGYLTTRFWEDCDGLIQNLRGSALDVSLEILRQRVSGRRLGIWGHLSHSVRPPNAVDLAIERWQMRHVDHVFAYTKRGAEVAVASGVEPKKVTAVMNSTDTGLLLEAYREISEERIGRLLREWSLIPGKIFCFVGGIDTAKRIEFFTQVLEILWRRDREVKFLVGGRGGQEYLLEPYVRRGQVRMLGRVDAHDKADLFRLAQAIVNPGRIGLLAVESLAVGIPILATEWGYHAPEVDYLTTGRDIRLSRNDATSFAELILSETNHSGELRRHSGQPFPNLADMVENFALGVRAMMAG